MIISLLSPHTTRSGNTTSSILLALALADLKRPVFLSHVAPTSSSFEQYLGLKEFEDKTSTPTQLVKLLREGAIQPDDIGDYSKSIVDYLDVFTSTDSRFSEEDALSLLNFIVGRTSKYDYLLFDIDTPLASPVAASVIKTSSLVILNVTTSLLDAQRFQTYSKELLKVCQGKKIMVLCSDYDPRVIALKDLKKALGLDASIYSMRSNFWLQKGANRGSLANMYKLGRSNDSDVVDVYRDAVALANAVSKARIAISKQARGVAK